MENMLPSTTNVSTFKGSDQITVPYESPGSIPVLERLLREARETERAVLLKFGEVVNPDIQPGLHASRCLDRVELAEVQVVHFLAFCFASYGQPAALGVHLHRAGPRHLARLAAELARKV